MTTTDTFKIGRIGKTHGVKGEVTFHFTDDVFDRTDADYVFVETEGLLVPFFFEEYRFRSETTALVKFADIDDANRAAELTGCDVYFDRALCDDTTDELTWQELVGYSLVDSATARPVGEITAVDLSTINTLFEVLSPDGQQLLIPANDELVCDIDRSARTITLRIPEGLLEI